MPGLAKLQLYMDGLKTCPVKSVECKRNGVSLPEGYFLKFFIQHCFVCRPSDSSCRLSRDVRILLLSPVLEFWNNLWGLDQPSRKRVVAPSRQAGGIDSFESIPGLLKSLKIVATGHWHSDALFNRLDFVLRNKK